MPDPAPRGPHADDHPSADAASLLDDAASARAAGDVVGMRTALTAALRAAERDGDAERMAEAALQLPLGQQFGLHPGEVPALLHGTLEAAGPLPDATRARLGAALARAWVYGGDPVRAARFADDATALAEATDDPVVRADVLDAALLVHWGPDDLPERVRLAARLDDAAAHVTDPEVRLSAHLWRLTTAWECLDVVAVQRQLRGLDLLAAESGSTRAGFFAASRRAMHALVLGDLEAADELITRTRELGAALAEPDVAAVLHSLDADRASQAGDTDALLREAAEFQSFGQAEGVPSVVGEAAVLWLRSGEAGRAADLALQLSGGGLAAVPRDVDFLLVVTSVVEVAAATGIVDVLAEGLALLEPLAGRAVLNAGAVSFHGVVEDHLAVAAAALGRSGGDAWRDAASAAYRRIGARWWESRLGGATTRRSTSEVLHLRPVAAGWEVGPAGATVTLPDLKGLRYLHALLARPGVDVRALALSDAVAGHPGAGVGSSDAGGVLDDVAVAAYRSRLADLEEELAEADAWSDLDRADRLTAERDALLGQLGVAVGLGGRRRRAGSTDERARVAVRKAIAATLDRLEGLDPRTARLLRDSVRTGTTCRYDPDPGRPVTWVLDPSG